MRRPLKWGLYLGVFAFTALLAINFCGTLFQCGCQSAWSAAAAHCNIHQAHGPHCPWCTHGGAGFVAGMVPVFLVQAWAVFRPGTWGYLTRLAVALVAFPVVGGVLGGTVGWMQGYWSR